MSRRWVSERKRDPYYKRAKRENYYSRAAYKLMQMDERFGIIRKGDAVIDLGAAPGGWSQVAVERSAPDGLVISIDLRRISEIKGAITMRGDAFAPETVEKIIALLESKGRGRADVILSDMSPNISGVYDIDHAKSIDLVKRAMELCGALLRPGGTFVAKVFEGESMKELKNEAKERFRMVKPHSPDATRERSSEIYIVCKGFRS
ncbi:MAG: RlmE family RNA methyltransferase [Euryarchaeota archaeon]|nr:RlmE family RNA methyltransferase [Euryarchaeota archaeon]